MLKLLIIVDTIVGIVLMSRNNSPWWHYLLLIGFNLLFYLIGDERGWFDENKEDTSSNENDENNKNIDRRFPTEALFAGIICIVAALFAYLLYKRALPDLNKTWEIVWTWSGIIMLSLLAILFLSIFFGIIIDYLRDRKKDN